MAKSTPTVEQLLAALEQSRVANVALAQANAKQEAALKAAGVTPKATRTYEGPTITPQLIGTFKRNADGTPGKANTGYTTVRVEEGITSLRKGAWRELVTLLRGPFGDQLLAKLAEHEHQLA